MMMKGDRSLIGSSGYRYGYNGQEKEDEINGSENSLAFIYRIYNSRLARFLSVDPLTARYPHYTPYSFAGNKPIAFVDLEGREEEWYNRKSKYSEGYVITLGLPNLPVAERWEYYDAPWHSDYAIITFFHNSAAAAWNGIATTWNDGLDGKTATDMVVEMEQTITSLTLEDVKLMAGDVRTYENIAGALATAYLTKRLTSAPTPKIKFTSNQLGKMGEYALRMKYGGDKQSFNTPLGSRDIDILSDGVAYEAKVGYKTASEFHRKQFAKDLYLLDQGLVDEVVWTFYKSPETGRVGASKGLLDMFRRAQQHGYNIRTQVLELSEEAIKQGGD